MAARIVSILIMVEIVNETEDMDPIISDDSRISDSER